MKLTTAIYRTLLGTYNVLPFKKAVSVMLRDTGLMPDRLYRDFKFEGEFEVKCGGKKFKLYHHGGTIENALFWKGLFNSWEPDTGWIWMQLCSHAKVIFDIGANTGVYSMVAKTINPSASVYAFEPSRETYSHLSQNNRLNNYDVACYEIAFSNADGTQTFFDIPNTNQTSASLSTDMFLENGQIKASIKGVETYTVQTRRLDTFIKEQQIPQIDLMKIDVEMHELEVVSGLGDYLRSFKPIIIIEVLSDKVADGLNEILGSDFMIIHLRGNNQYDVVSSLTKRTENWNYLIFHKSLSAKIMDMTSLRF
ncbi:MAG: FkbM family methyltransferase [Bacteroidetes bacterium]|nr:FkbM family methyltransferase [Bacteroidota bacterium]